LIDARRIGLMGPHAFLINAARGGIVDEDALIDALEAAGSPAPGSTSGSTNRRSTRACSLCPMS